MKKFLSLIIICMFVMVSLSAGGNTTTPNDSEENQDNELEWSTSKLAQMLPIPKNAKGYIDADNEEKYEVILTDVSMSDFNAYVDDCIEKGFTINQKKFPEYYCAENERGYMVSLEYSDSEMGITLRLAE